IGFDHRSQEIRTFAVDRIRALEETGTSFKVREDFDFDRWTAANFGVVSEPASRVRIRFDAAWAHYIRERVWHRSQSLESAPDGGLELTMEVGGDQELANWILSFGPGAEVLEPPGLRNRVSEALREALTRYTPAAKNEKSEKEGN
ncbi:MAG: WYL domain-containing protein, partial [Myxococcota bacterium]|nr:WYL domain-containing protein [Myxococcota bacterium]